MKPDNILITANGVLKIADFGMAQPSCPVLKSDDSEGDRRYIAPEILRGTFGKAADIFSLGLIVLEMGTNCDLPDNGQAWVQLRSHSFVGVPTLTVGADFDLVRSTVGISTDKQHGIVSRREPTAGNGVADGSFGTSPYPALLQPPRFMADPYDTGSLDALVRWMLVPDPERRPTISELINWHGLAWVACRRNLAATVFEGNWGPVDGMTLLGQDTDLTMTEAG